MYTILVYDIAVERIDKVLKTCRKYLTWIQNSVLEGEITTSNLHRLQTELKSIINPQDDSIVLYILRTDKYIDRRTLGKTKGEPTKIL